MVQVEQHTDAALAIVGEEHRALEHFDWREAVGAKRYGPSCHSRLEVHLLHHSVLLEKRVQLWAYTLFIVVYWTAPDEEERNKFRPELLIQYSTDYDFESDQ